MDPISAANALSLKKKKSRIDHTAKWETVPRLVSEFCEHENNLS